MPFWRYAHPSYIWENDLPHHFEQEEKALIERIRDKEGSQSVMERVLSDHKRFATLAQEVEAMQGDVFEKIQLLTDFVVMAFSVHFSGLRRCSTVRLRPCGANNRQNVVFMRRFC